MAPPNKKPRGPSAYFIFTEEKRPEVMARLQAESENGKAAAPAIAKALGELWGSMSEEEKDSYRQKAKERAESAAAAVADGDAAAGDQEQDATAADAPTQAVAAAIPKHVVKRIVLTDDEVQRVSADALWVVGEAARLFVQQLAAKSAAAAAAKKRKTIKLQDFEHVVRCDKRLVAAGLKDVVNNKRLYELNGVAPNAVGGRKTPGQAAAAAAAAASKAGGSNSQEPVKQQQEAEGVELAEAAAQEDDEQQQQQSELTDEERIALEEAKRRKAAELMKARAAKAAERKKQKETELAKSTHKITTFFVSSKPDQFV